MKKTIKPFVAPPFNPGNYKKKVDKYTWWSWNPNFPYWSKSCWGGNTIDEALKTLDNPLAHKMRYNHNKLIEEIHGQYIEVYDLPFNPESI